MREDLRKLRVDVEQLQHLVGYMADEIAKCHTAMASFGAASHHEAAAPVNPADAATETGEAAHEPVSTNDTNATPQPRSSPSVSSAEMVEAIDLDTVLTDIPDIEAASATSSQNGISGSNLLERISDGRNLGGRKRGGVHQ